MTATTRMNFDSVAMPVGEKNPALKKFLYYFTLFGVFSSLLVVHFGLSIRLTEAALLLLLLLVNFSRISAGLLAFVAYLAISGAIGVANGTDSLTDFGVEFRGITISLIYYYFFFRIINNDYERAFATYVKLAFAFAVIALPLWAESCLAAHSYVRLQGLATEPAYFCELTLPAFYWYASQLLTHRRYASRVAVFSIAFALSSSSIGYITVAVGVLLLFSERRRRVMTAAILVSLVLGLTYTVSPFFQERVNSMLISLTTDDLPDSNLTTYSLLSNAFITRRVLAESPWIGNGLGSHPTSHERYLAELRIPQFFIDNHLETVNAKEAGSLTLRVLSEFGILGLLGLLGFLIRFHVSKAGRYSAISNAVLTTFVLQLIHGGPYYLPEQFFFVFIYILNFRKYNYSRYATTRRTAVRAAVRPQFPSPAFGLAAALPLPISDRRTILPEGN